MPRGLIALGHSGLTGEGSDPARPGEEARENSWATGTAAEVNSIYRRMIEILPETDGNVANLARGGAPAAALPDQARSALRTVAHPALVIIQTIDGDIRCDGTDEDHVVEFGVALSVALKEITDASPESRILVLGQTGRPALEAEALADQPDERRALGGTGICDFFDPDGNLVPERLDTLTQIIEAYESEQARVCGEVPQCHTDDGLMAAFLRKDGYVSGDGNHLTAQGNAAIAERTWPLVAEILDFGVAD